MTKGKLSTREIVLLIILAVIVIGACYYFFFLTPHNNEMTSIANQIADVDSQIETAQVQVASLQAKQAEIDEILKNPNATEIAPYDNAKEVMKQLNSVLNGKCIEYDIRFSDPDIDESGLVRRGVQLSFRTATYAEAKAILKQLSESHWRCIITNVAVECGAVAEIETQSTVSANLTFYESTNIEK